MSEIPFELIEAPDRKLGKHEAGYARLYRTPEGWILRCWKCGIAGMLPHKVTESSGKVTVDPSIICPECQAHYFIRDSRVVQT